MMIKVIGPGSEKPRMIPCPQGKSILEALQGAGLYVSAVCGGRGRCKKCTVRLVEGCLKGSPETDKVLACQAFPETDCVISLDSQNFKQSQVQSRVNDVRIIEDGVLNREAQGNGYGVAVDIGTTTIAMTLIRLKDGAVLGKHGSVNRQQSFGADVISRIQADVEGNGPMMRRLVLEDLYDGITKMTEAAGLELYMVKRIVVAANTVMCHILLGYSCEGLGQYPFRPVSVKTRYLAGSVFFGPIDEYQGRFPKNWEVQVQIIPGISAFIGGDIVAGMIYCGFGQSGGNRLFIDLGTNAEMVLLTDSMMIGASAAAGPAFEGGNISRGMGSVPGAVHCADIDSQGRLHVKTVGNAPAEGICGTGVVELTSELVRCHLVDETGLLVDALFETGVCFGKDKTGQSLYLTQDDLREIQLAKASVRAGIQVLMKKGNVTASQIDQVYIAGGFGFYLDLKKAAVLGLVPKQLVPAAKAMGNTSVGGAAKILLQEELLEEAQNLADVCKEINLGNDSDFGSFYMTYMGFEEN